MKRGPVSTLSIVLIVLLVLVIWAALSAVRQVQQYQRGVVFRFGKVRPEILDPGLHFIIPIADKLVKVTMQTVVLGVPAQGAITRDNVTLTVDAVVYFKVIDPVKALVNVTDYPNAVSQVSQTSLRAVIGRVDLDTLLSDREQINDQLKSVIDGPTEEPWGLRIERVEVKDIALPETMKRSMSRQAEAERERRARVIAADGEFQASQKLSEAAAAMAATPGALQLRLLQTVVDVASEKNSTLVMPFPVELLRFFDHAAGSGTTSTTTATTPDAEPLAPVTLTPSVAAPSVAAPSVAAPSVAAPSVAAPSATSLVTPNGHQAPTRGA